MAGIDFENDYTEVEPSGICSNVSMSSCKFKNNKYDVSSTIRDDLGPVPRGQLVTINDCNFTAPLRLNRTNGLTFNNCHIVGISSHDNSISPWYVSKDLVFNNCVFDELNPYLTISAEEQNKKFINPTYPEDIRYSTTFQHNLPVGKALKFTIPKPLVGEVEFTAFCSNSNYSAIQMPINTTIYTFGPSQRLTGIRDIKIKASQDSTPRYSMYKNTPVFSYINYAEDADNFNIYFAIGGDLISNPLGGNTPVNIFLTSKTKFIVVEAPVSENPGVTGMYGGKWSTLSAIAKSVIDVTAIPSSVTFPSKEMFSANMLADLPTSLTSDKVGFSQYVLDNSYKCPVFWDSFSSVFRTADGNRALVRSVTSSDALNTLTDQMTIDDRGYVVYTTVNNSYLTWNGYDWVNEDGSLFTKVKYVKRTVGITTLNNVFSYSNVVYKIVGDIDLGGGTLTIATGSTLDFQGGSFSNGTIVGNNTKINAGLDKIFGTDVTLSGTWNIVDAYSEWFGAKKDGISDDYLPIQKTLDSFRLLKLNKGTYNITLPIKITSNTSIYGVNNKTCILQKTGNSTIDDINAVLIITSTATYVSGVNLSLFTISSAEYNVDYGIYAPQFSNSTLNCIDIWQCKTGIYLTTSWGLIFNQLDISSNTRYRLSGSSYGYPIDTTYGIYCDSSDGTTFILNRCYVHGVAFGYYIKGIHKINFNNATADNTHNTSFHLEGCEGVLNNCGCENACIKQNSYLMYIANSMLTFENFVTAGVILEETNVSAQLIRIAYGSVAKFINSKIQDVTVVGTFYYTLVSHASSVEYDRNKTGFKTPNSFSDAASIIKVIEEDSIIVYKQGNFSNTTYFGVRSLGSTASRPTNAPVGFIYYDMTLSKCIVWNGTAWTNLDGTALT
jgi:hypothetical protein